MAAYVIQVIRKEDHIQRGIGSTVTTQVRPTTPVKGHVATWSLNTTDNEATIISSMQAVIDTLGALSYAG